MALLDKDIYYLDNELFLIIKKGFTLIDKRGWYELYKSNDDNFYYRLDVYDKFQQQYFTKISDVKQWVDFDDTTLRIQLLEENRGLSQNICKWVNCNDQALNNSAFCSEHTYNMGVRM